MKIGGKTVTELEVPDSAQRVRVSLSRHCTAKPSEWTDPKREITWSLELSISGVWIALGSSTTGGGIVSDENGECGESWDDSPLISGIGRRLRITLVPHGGEVDTEMVVKWAP